MAYLLMPGQALVITGPQGCGKTTAARATAKLYGSFVEVDAVQLRTLSGIQEVLSSKPDTVIVDGFPNNHDVLPALKALVAGETIALRARYGQAHAVKCKAPNFIFCTTEGDPFPDWEGDRRYSVIRLGQAKRKEVSL